MAGRVGGASALSVIPHFTTRCFPLFFSPLHLPVCRHPDAPTTTPIPTTATATAAATTIPSTASSLEAHPGTVPPSGTFCVLLRSSAAAMLRGDVLISQGC